MFEIVKFIWFLLRALLLWEEKRKQWQYLHNTVNPSLVSRVLLTALKSFKKKKKTPKYNGPYKATFGSFRYGVGHNRLI